MTIRPSKNTFVKLSKRNNLIVLSCKFFSDWLTPLATYYGLQKRMKAESFLLESVEGEEKICRFSFLGFKPICTFKSKGTKISVTGQGAATFVTKQDPLSELKKLVNTFTVAPKEHLRFFGGFVGYVGYDMVRFYEPIGPQKKDSLGTPDSYLMLPQYLIIFDHLKHQIEVLSFVSLTRQKSSAAVYEKEKRALMEFCNALIKPHQLPELSFEKGSCKLRSNVKRGDFLSAVRRAKKHIKEGDIIQTVLSQRFSMDFAGDSFTVYRYLRALNPSPYMFYINGKDVKIAGASPEMLLRCEEGELITRPIAGTRKRGKNAAQDKALQNSLLSDPKEIAEHIMLVDLARNDLGRVAREGTVKVPIFMTIEGFSHVMHIVSEVRATLNRGQDIFSSLVSCFPAGTVSGAPKVRAMQIINDLEPEKRGIYAGSVGYFSFTNSLDTCIIIRTILFKNKKAYIQAGAGIVSDSVPAREYKETVNKAQAQMLAVQYACGGKKKVKRKGRAL